MSSALSCEQRCSDVMYRPMNFEGALQLFNIAASHMKFTKKKISTSQPAQTAASPDSGCIQRPSSNNQQMKKRLAVMKAALGPDSNTIAHSSWMEPQSK